MMTLQPEFTNPKRQILAIALPIFWFAMEIFCSLGHRDQKEGPKILLMTQCLLVIVSWVTSMTVYMTSFGYEMSIHTIFPLFAGTIFMMVGNYMPKIKINLEDASALVILMPWLCLSRNGITKIQRFAGRLWVLCGFAIIMTMFFQSIAFLFVDSALMMAMFVVPAIYSRVKFENKYSLMQQGVEKND
jgi:uncharacterized membrane protein